jgi:hypothetical protein
MKRLIITEEEKAEIKGLYEQVTVSGAVDLIKNNLPIIVNIILSVIPVTLLPRIIYYIVSGKPKELYNEMSGYKDKIEQALKSKKINVTLQDITDNLKMYGSELEKMIKDKAGL